ncbi:peptide chain release factor N(5)-glutamine methyltransferase [Polaribacter sp. M15]
MQLKQFKIYFSDELSEIYPKEEIATFFFILIEEYLHLKRIDTVLKPDFVIQEERLTLLIQALEKLKKEQPLQYIIGKTEFFGYPFFVDKNTLIPRPETEELVEWVLKDVQDKRQKNREEQDKFLQILDIGTGSGCIPISLAKNLSNVSISAIDVSLDALKVATKNATLNKVNINFIERNILSATQLDCNYDIIISNPPYVRELEKVEIQNNVLENEPHLALFVADNNPLVFYDKIADLAKRHLLKDGMLFFEINQYLGKETANLLQQKGFQNIKLQKDLFKNNRMIKATL